MSSNTPSFAYTAPNAPGHDLVCDDKDKDCYPNREVFAVIIDPSLGHPLLIPKEGAPKTISIFIAAPGSARGDFMVYDEDKDKGFPKRTKAGYFRAAHHLRLFNYKDGKPTQKVDVDNGLLKGHDEYASEEHDHMGVFLTGLFEAGPVKNRFGEIVGNLDAKTVDFYKEFAAGNPLDDIYEIIIDAGWLGLSDFSHPKTIAWMVTTDRALAEMNPNRARLVKGLLKDMPSCELSDIIFVNAVQDQGSRTSFIKGMRAIRDDKLNFPPNDVTFDMDSWYKLMVTSHPIVSVNAAPLKVANMPNIRISPRQFVLARNPAKIMEETDGSSEPAIKPMNVAYHSAHSLLVKQKAGGAKVVVINGSAIESYRDLTPGPQFELRPKISDVWKACNIMTTLKPWFEQGDPFYPSGLSCLMLIHLMDEAYKADIAPFFVRGERDSYMYPQGVAPKFNTRFSSMWEDPKKLKAFGSTASFATHAAVDAGKDFLKEQAGVKGVWGLIYDKSSDFLKEVLKDKSSEKGEKVGEKATVKDFAPSERFSDKEIEEGSEYAAAINKQSLAALYNLTSYELILAAGPGYAQSLTPKSFDEYTQVWMDCLICPLADWKTTVGDQILLGLSWGNDEVIGTPDPDNIAERQGKFFPPRCSDGVTVQQNALIHDAALHKNGGDKISVFSNFPLFNFGTGIPYRGKDNTTRQVVTLAPRSYLKARNEAINTLTTLAGLAIPGYGLIVDYFVGKFLTWAVAQARQFFAKESNAQWNQANQGGSDSDGTLVYLAQEAKNVQYHFSGHGFRSGVYKADIRYFGKMIDSSANFSRYYDYPQKVMNPFKNDNFSLMCDVCIAGNPLRDKSMTLTPNHSMANGGAPVGLKTLFIVNSSSGLMGEQNYNRELSGGFGNLYNYSSWHLVPPTMMIATPATGEISAIQAKDCENKPVKPRLCVALDHLHTMGIEWPVLFLNSYDRLTGDQVYRNQNWEKWKQYDAQIIMMLGEKTKALQCVDPEKIYLVGYNTDTNSWDRFRLEVLGKEQAFSKTGEPFNPVLEFWRRDVYYTPPTFALQPNVYIQTVGRSDLPGAAGDDGNFESPFHLSGKNNAPDTLPRKKNINDYSLSVTNNMQDLRAYGCSMVKIPVAALAAYRDGNHQSLWFCEIGLKKPQALGAYLDEDFDSSDNWVFPIEFKETVVPKKEGTPQETDTVFASIYRCSGERSEVPNWKELSKQFKDLTYPRMAEKKTNDNVSGETYSGQEKQVNKTFES